MFVYVARWCKVIFCIACPLCFVRAGSLNIFRSWRDARPEMLRIILVKSYGFDKKIMIHKLYRNYVLRKINLYYEIITTYQRPKKNLHHGVQTTLSWETLNFFKLLLILSIEAARLHHQSSGPSLQHPHNTWTNLIGMFSCLPSEMHWIVIQLLLCCTFLELHRRLCRFLSVVERILMVRGSSSSPQRLLKLMQTKKLVFSFVHTLWIWPHVLRAIIKNYNRQVMSCKYVIIILYLHELNCQQSIKVLSV